MPDAYSQRGPMPDDWHDAFAALPLEPAPADGWSRLSARLQLQLEPATADGRSWLGARLHTWRRQQWPMPLAIAATLVLAVALPWRIYDPADRSPTDRADAASVASPRSAPSATAAADASLEQLYAESAQLESLLQVARDDRVSSATAAALSGELDARIAAIDAALMQPGLSPERQLWLWRSRVEALRSLTGFESNRRWLAANGKRYDGALARVD